jgi:nucleotide-binding universal stress UspA family protein
MYRSILVPVDGSTFAEHALPLALSLARHSGASLHLFHVVQPLASVYSEAPLFVESECDLEARIQERMRTYLDELAGRLAKRWSAVVTSSLLAGEVVPSFLAHTAETKPDLVVMTTHGRGPLGRFWLGSVADELARVLPVPLLLVRPQEKAEPDLETEPPLRQILIPLDGSKLAEQIVRPAIELGRLTRAGFTLLRVVKPAPLVAFPTGSPMLDVEAQSVLGRIETIQG